MRFLLQNRIIFVGRPINDMVRRATGAAARRRARRRMRRRRLRRFSRRRIRAFCATHFHASPRAHALTPRPPALHTRWRSRFAPP
jgi:hypothetical protein